MAAWESTESSAPMAAWEPTVLLVLGPSEQEPNDMQCSIPWERQLTGGSSSSTVLDSASPDPSCESSSSSMMGEVCLECDPWRQREEDVAPDARRQRSAVEWDGLCVVNTFLEFRDPAPESESSRARAKSAPAPAARGHAGPTPWRRPLPAAEVCPSLGPTWGSMLHASGRCRPCQFAGCGCKSGVACRFCHICSAADRKRLAKGQGHFSWRGLRKATAARARARR